ncbi:hypothetical protein Pfo_006554 [Paulownia fortunei]|nr:hypothetical protein Pfo_006554 [Paulownia fortunei]
MGKYMRKVKVTGDVAVMEVSQSSLGVRTRAKTLALQRLQSSASVAAPPPSKPDSCYLELRSRRLEKPVQQQNSRKARHTCGCGGKEDTEAKSGEEFPRTSLISGSVEAEDLGIEASFGENNLDCEARESGSTRESTPCSLIRVTDTISAPGSTSKQTCSSATSQRIRPLLINVPTARDLEEFFACEEQSQQHLFMEKYNFDIVNDLPLPGRYEWVRVSP